MTLQGLRCLKESYMTFGSLFAGIGGFDLGFERAGLECRWQVEIDPFAQKVLAKHWPAVRRWDDVRTFPPEPIDDWKVDVICGGFPCQDISNAGNKAGIDGDRSGLWSEIVRTLCIIQPRFLVVENVSALTFRGLGRVLGDLAKSGFDAEWDCLPASAFGADHHRDRVFIVGVRGDSEGLRRWPTFRAFQVPQPYACRDRTGTWWDSGCGLRRVANGIPNRVDRRRGLGNAVVPQVAEFIGRRLMEATS